MSNSPSSQRRLTTDSESEFRYSAGDIERLTGGQIKLKTINNWVTNNYWVSELQQPLPGLARKYSRENVLEAMVAAKLTVAGISRVRAKFFIEGMELATSGIDHDTEHEWYYRTRLEFRDGLIDAHELSQCTPDMIAAELANNPGNVFVFSVSQMFRDLEAITK